MIRTLIFDLGRVLIPFDFHRGYSAMSAQSGLATEEIRKRFAASGLAPEFESGQITGLEFHSRVEALLETNIAYDRFCEIWSSVFLPETLIPETMIQALHLRYRLVVLSNTNCIHFSFVHARYPILGHFDDYVLSHEVKAMKPSPVIYAAAIQAARCPAQECFFTDDIEAYVEGARLAGIDAVQFQNAEQIGRELKSRGVEW